MFNPLERPLQKQNETIPAPFPHLTDHLLISATTKSGKSHLCKTLLNTTYKKKFDDILLFCPTASTENYCSLFNIPDETVFEEVDEETIFSAFEKVKKIFEEQKGNYFSLFVFDDCAEDLRTIKGFPRLLKTCRHYGVTVWVLTQYVRDLTPGSRNNSIAYIIFPNISPENLKTLGESTIGSRNLAEVMEFVDEENDSRNTKYGFFYWNKSDGTKKWYGIADPDMRKVEFSQIVDAD